MSFSISDFAIHQLYRSDSGELELVLSSENPEISANTEKLVSSLHSTLNSKAQGFAKFKESSCFLGDLGKLHGREVGFQEFSVKSAKKLHEEMSKYPFADEGVVVFCQYQSLATEYMVAAVLTPMTSLSVKEGLELASTDYLDLSKADLITRIDLSLLNFGAEGQSSNREIVYSKGRVGRKVGDFFLDFLEAESGLDVKAQNLVLTQAIQDFTSDSGLERDEVLQFNKTVKDYCDEQSSSGCEVVIKELSGELPSVGDKSFYEYTQENGYELEESFPASSAVTKKLTKFVGAGGGLNISFDSLLLNERIFYNAETDTLTIKGTPPNLRSMLVRNPVSSVKEGGE